MLTEAKITQFAKIVLSECQKSGLIEDEYDHDLPEMINAVREASKRVSDQETTE